MLGQANSSFVACTIRLASHDSDVFFHELAYAAHERGNGQLRGGQHRDQEIVAEFAAAVLSTLYFGENYGLGNAKNYIAGYA